MNNTYNNRSETRLFWVAANLLIAGLWLRLFWPLLPYFSVIFEREDFRLNQILLLITLALFALQIRAYGMQIKLSAPPRSDPLPLLLFVGGSIAFILVERFLNINTLSAMLFVLSGYGLLGLWMAPNSWRRRLPAALMLLGVLPLGEHLQTFIGYPMRIFTAKLVGSIMQMGGVSSVGIDTILVFENGVSQVDLPCSGVKSLWTGALFFVSATWIEQRAMTLRWWLIALAMPLLLFVANFARVFILVLVGEVGGMHLLAEMIHIPLGVLAFVIVCGLTLLGLRTIKGTVEAEAETKTEVAFDPLPSYGRDISYGHDISCLTLDAAPERRVVFIPRRRPWLALALSILLGALILLYSPRPWSGTAVAVEPWQFSEQLRTEALPLTPDEAAWFVEDGAESVERVRFAWQDISGQTVSGSMILVTSRTWRAHHRPERCFEVYGLSLDQSITHLTSNQQPIRSVRLGNGGSESLYAATYWFQSANQITDDYGVRVWADTKMNSARWVLVSILFDGVNELSEPAVEKLIGELQQTVGERLQG